MNKHMDEENKKLDAARDKGLNYDRNLPPIPKYDGNWADAFIVALKNPELRKCIKRMGIDRTDWKEATRANLIVKHGFDEKEI